MRLFWVAVTAGVLLAFAAMNHHAGTAEASLCGPPAMRGAILSEEGDDVEYALVTATITGVPAGYDDLPQYGDRVAYRIDDIRYMPSARSEIQITDGTFSARHVAIPSVGVGEQVVIPFSRYEHRDDAWGTFCFGVYHPGVLDYVDWFVDLRNARIGGDGLRPSELYRFSLHPYALEPRDPPTRIEYWDRVSVSRLASITATESASRQDYPVLGNRYVFDTVYDIYNADSQTVAELSAWDTRVTVRNLMEGQLYFVHSHKSAIPYHDTRVISMVPLEDSYELMRNVFSSANVDRLDFYNTVIPGIRTMGDEIEENDILKGKVRAGHNAEYDPDGQASGESDSRGYKMRVTVYQMDREILDEWKALLKKYDLDGVEADYVLKRHVSSSHYEKPPYETWRDYLIPTVKDQLGWGTPPFEVLCEDMLHLVIVPDGTPACVAASEAQRMLEDNSAIMQVRPAVILNVDG